MIGAVEDEVVRGDDGLGVLGGEMLTVGNVARQGIEPWGLSASVNHMPVCVKEEEEQKGRPYVLPAVGDEAVCL